MKIWFTEIGEPLPLEGNMRLLRYGLLTQALAAKGHEVTWFTSNFTHSTKRHLTTSDLTVDWKGVRLRVFETPGYQRNISLARFRYHAAFAKRFQAAAQESPSPDLIVSPIPTLEVAEVATRFALARHIPILTDIRDEWPDEFLSILPGPLKWAGRVVLRKAYARARYICSNVTGIMGISRHQLEYGLSLTGRAQGPTDGVFPLGYSEDNVFDPAEVDAAERAWRAQGLDPQQELICCLFTSINKRVNLATVIDAARALEGQVPVKFVLCGDGTELPAAKRRAAGLRSVLFPGWVDGPQIQSLMRLSQVGLAPYSADARMSLPNKPFEYFSGGLAVVSSIQGELKTVLSEAECGITYPSNSVEEFLSAIRRLAANREECREMGRRARRVLEARFTTRKIFEDMESHFRLVTGK